MWGKEPGLRKWIELETYKEKIAEAAKEKKEEFPEYLLQYLSIALGVRYSWFEYADWSKIVSAFYVCLTKSPKISLPITSPSGEQTKPDPWEYDGRTWHLYSHMIAKTYGWSLEYISRLRVRDALAIIQEIMTDAQLEREFYYGLSEVAYSYDSGSKKSKFVPLPRPGWMRQKVEPQKIKKVPIPVSMMPVGAGMVDGILPDELMPKEYEKDKTGQTQSL